MTNSKEVLSGLSSAKTLASIPAGVRSAFIQAVGGAAYYWVDGSTPANDGSSGHALAAGESFLLTQAKDIRGSKVIQANGSTTTIMVSYQAP